MTQEAWHFFNDYEREHFVWVLFKNTLFLSIMLVNHTLVNATYPFFYNTPNNYGLDHETRSVNIFYK